MAGNKSLPLRVGEVERLTEQPCCRNSYRQRLGIQDCVSHHDNSGLQHRVDCDIHTGKQASEGLHRSEGNLGRIDHERLDVSRRADESILVRNILDCVSQTAWNGGIRPQLLVGDSEHHHRRQPCLVQEDRWN